MSLSFNLWVYSKILDASSVFSLNTNQCILINAHFGDYKCENAENMTLVFGAVYRRCRRLTCRWCCTSVERWTRRLSSLSRRVNCHSLFCCHWYNSCQQTLTPTWSSNTGQAASTHIGNTCPLGLVVSINVVTSGPASAWMGDHLHRRQA